MEKQPLDKSVVIFGCGWLGLPLAKQLKKEGYTVTGTTTSQSRNAELVDAGIEPRTYVLGDKSLDIELGKAKTAIVCVPSKNVEAFELLVNQFSEASIKHVIFVSSTSVYKAALGAVNEESELNMGDLARIEELFSRNKGFESTIVRFAGLMGPNRHPGNFFKNKTVPNPEGVVNMIHLDDCIGVLSEILNQNIWGETFNAAAETHPSRREFYTAAKENLKLPQPTFDENKELASGKEVVSQKLMRHLDYRFIHSDLLEALGNCK